VRATAAQAQLAGALFVFLAACFFAAKSVLIKLAYRYGVAPATLLALRMAFSLPFFAAVALWSGRTSDQRPLSRGDWAAVMLLGFLGYYLAAYLDFLGLTYITASLERLIVFLYPTVVVILSAVLFKRRVRAVQITALAVSYVGIGLVLAENLRLVPDREALLLGGGLVFGSAVIYSFYLVFGAEVVRRVGAVRFTAYAMGVASAVAFLQFAVTHSTRDLRLPAPVYALTFLMAVVCTVLPSFLMSEGLRRVGANRAATIGTIGPAVTIALGHVLLGEPITWVQIAGAALVLCGVLIVTLRPA
jgi:drug/metabolite transporter (DMT)-like permease